MLSTVERALGKASELREKTDGDMKARAEAVVRDSETWKSKLAEAQHRLEQITQSREERTGGLESLQHLSPEELILAVVRFAFVQSRCST